MASQDFIALMTKLHVERYSVLSTRIEGERVGDGFSTKATVVLEKEGKQVTLESAETDFILYIVELRQVADTMGEHKFTHVKDLNQYNADVEHLVDLDRSKVNNAVKEIRSGKFKREYIIAELVDEFLKNSKNIKDTKFVPLKDDYHHILAAVLIESNEVLKAREKVVRRFPGTEKVIDAAEQIMKSFRPTGNGIKDYRLFRSYVNFSIDALFDSLLAQIPAMNDTIKEFIRRGKVDAEIAIPRMMNIYARMMELSAPVINLLRVGLELKRGVSSPVKYYKLAKNIGILKSDIGYGSLFACLDEQIRHADAHVSITIDKASQKVILSDIRGRKPKIMRAYTFDDLLKMIQVMQDELFPALLYTLMLHEIAALLLVLVSKEYKFLLLALGNC